MTEVVAITDENLAAIVERLRAAGDDQAADAIVILDAEAQAAPERIVEHTARETNHTRLEAALQALPKPVTAEAILDAARGVLPSAQFGQFSKWMVSCGGELVGRLNG